MIGREIVSVIREAAKKMPVISITGPRQSGKTTLAKSCFDMYDYVNLEDPEQREFALSDPRGFLQGFKKNLIIDEAQYAPELFSYIQVITDEKNIPGQFILTGSQNFLLLEKISQSLAGRVALFNLLPFSIAELKAVNSLPGTYEDVILNGFYPRIYDKDLSPAQLYPSYVNTYIERDVRQIINVRDLSTFQRFLKLCAGHTGQLLNTNSMAVQAGVDHKTIRQWISVLETSFVVFLLQPHYKNFNKRIVKTPRLYFYDTGLACYLLGIQNSEQLNTHYHKGALFENMIIADIIKNLLNKGERPNVYFWRDNTGHEVDCLVERGTEINPVEIKSSKTFRPDFFRNIEFYNKLSDTGPENSYVVYGGNTTMKRKSGSVLNWKNLNSITE